MIQKHLTNLFTTHAYRAETKVNLKKQRKTENNIGFLFP